MAEKTSGSVTMRVRVGDSEVEVTGPVDFVERKISEFIDRQKQLSVTTALETADAAGEPSTTAPREVKAMSHAQFFRKVSPKNDVDRILAAGYYLERFGREEEK